MAGILPMNATKDDALQKASHVRLHQIHPKVQQVVKSSSPFLALTRIGIPRA